MKPTSEPTANAMSNQAYNRRQILKRLGAVLTGMVLAERIGSGVRAGATMPYPYGGAAFSGFVQDSYSSVPSTGISGFESWFETAFERDAGVHLKGAGPSLLEHLVWQRDRLGRAAISRPGLELEVAEWVHRSVKRLIPRFSLERGFEFVYTVSRGERQCLLQSVLIAALLQAMGLEAGVVMVWQNERGQTSNNGHAVTRLRLSSGRDVLVDASDPAPFMTHRGLFALDARGGTFRFVLPRYTQEATIEGYTDTAGKPLPVRRIETLGVRFLRSQFFYYRGERAIAGFMGSPSTPSGLEASAKFLRESIRLEPNNPLAQYVLGHVYRRLGRTDLARAQYEKAYALYLKQGFVPQGPQDAMTNYVQKAP